jgi:hypothetical protein
VWPVQIRCQPDRVPLFESYLLLLLLPPCFSFILPILVASEIVIANVLSLLMAPNGLYVSVNLGFSGGGVIKSLSQQDNDPCLRSSILCTTLIILFERTNFMSFLSICYFDHSCVGMRYKHGLILAH